MIQIPIHSATDLITNSSTVIFTYSEGCPAALKEMIDELFKTFGVDKTFDDVFTAVVLCTNDEFYAEWFENHSDEVALDPEKVYELVKDVKEGKVEKPEWFKKAEESNDSYDYFSPSTSLYLIPKMDEYTKLGRLVKNFLYSTSHEATRDG